MRELKRRGGGCKQATGQGSRENGETGCTAEQHRAQGLSHRVLFSVPIS